VENCEGKTEKMEKREKFHQGDFSFCLGNVYKSNT
jgi:hypothetical protein